MITFFHKAEEVVIATLMAAMTLLVVYEVYLRFVLSKGTMWAQELTLHVCALLVLVGAPYGLRVGKHISVDALIKKLQPFGQRVATSLAAVFGLIYCGLMIYGSYIYAEKMYSIHLELEDMPIQRWVAHGIPMVYSFSLLSWRLLLILYHVAKGNATTIAGYDEAKESLKLVAQSREAALK